ncbi:MAG: type II toxin-antitoxin system Phd/YefM family antitoxin [Oscillospiraceae bacterium]|nr:type II toxin-antitoxin system Phd/YefM family antitoxin [Oscillospiraceae bacterium]
MNFITVRDLRTAPKTVWDTLKEKKEIVITNNGRPSALMIPVTEANFDDILATVRQVNAMRIVNRMQRQSVKAGLGGMSLGDINAEIAAARAERAQ